MSGKHLHIQRIMFLYTSLWTESPLPFATPTLVSFPVLLKFSCIFTHKVSAVLCVV